MAKDTNKVSNMYGRARRIEFAEKCVYIVVGILAVFLVFYFISHTFNKVDENVNFAYLKKYMEQKGYTCSLLHLPGGKCSSSNGIKGYTFIRYENGFEYIVKTKAYSLTIRLVSKDDNSIKFKTTTDAIAGYKAKEYSCTYKDNIIGGLDKCIEINENTELDLGAYTGVIEQAMYDLNELIDASGYNKNKLLEDNEWVRKK
ncbi:MAG TPA: hypothetical protein DCE23_08370 [Firmicutes bacterium]|nr:hypothetical protein [Bacillota bacterium]